MIYLEGLEHPEHVMQTFLPGPPNREIDFYPVRVLGRVVDLPIRMPNPSPTLEKNLASMGPGILSVLGLGSGGSLLKHFQTPTLHWRHFSLRQIQEHVR